MSIYITHVTDRDGRIHRVEVSGSDRTAAMRDALAKVPGAQRVTLKGERNEREATVSMGVLPLDRYAIPGPPLRVPRARAAIGWRGPATFALVILIAAIFAWRG